MVKGEELTETPKKNVLLKNPEKIHAVRILKKTDTRYKTESISKTVPEQSTKKKQIENALETIIGSKNTSVSEKNLICRNCGKK